MDEFSGKVDGILESLKTLTQPSKSCHLKETMDPECLFLLVELNERLADQAPDSVEDLHLVLQECTISMLHLPRMKQLCWD